MEVLGLVEDGPAAAAPSRSARAACSRTAFHPEVTGDHRFHELFVEMVRNALAEDARARAGATGTRDADGRRGRTDVDARAEGTHAGQ